jgi:carbonic anhydrase
MIMKNSNALDQLFANNREWAEAMIAKDANFFKRLVSQQAPE